MRTCFKNRLNVLPVDTASKVINAFDCFVLLTEPSVQQGGVLAMTRELAMVHAKEGIRINSLCPYVRHYICLPWADLEIKVDR